MKLVNLWYIRKERKFALKRQLPSLNIGLGNRRNKNVILCERGFRTYEEYVMIDVEKNAEIVKRK